MDIWNGDEHGQIQEGLLLLEKALVFVSQKADGLISQAIESVLQNWRLGDPQIENRDPGRGPRGAIAGETGVGVLEYPALTRYTQKVAYRVSMY